MGRVKHMSEKRIHITQGEHATGNEEDTMINTLLGSCVAVCLWDEVAKVGGMNHMLLAMSDAGNGATCNLSGINAMELLINDMIKLGASRNRLKAKAFGGARMVAGLSDIGQSNAEFALEFLKNEGIECEGHSLGGTMARNIRFWPASGRVQQRMTSTQVVEPTVKEEEGNDLELF